jgi:hypothetical protein
MSSDATQLTTGKPPSGSGRGADDLPGARDVFKAGTLQSNCPGRLPECRSRARGLSGVGCAGVPVTVFNDHLADADALVERLQPFDMVCVMRKRTPMTSSSIERLPRLRLIASTAMRNVPVDLRAAEEHGVQVVHTGYTSAPTIRRTRLSAQWKRMKPCAI